MGKKEIREGRRCSLMGRAQQRHQTDGRGIQEGKAENGGANGEERKVKPCGEKIENKLKSKHQTIWGSAETIVNS